MTGDSINTDIGFSVMSKVYESMENPIINHISDVLYRNMNNSIWNSVRFNVQNFLHGYEMQIKR